MNSSDETGDQRMLLQNRFVEFFPVIEVVKIDRVFAGAGVVGELVGAED